MSNKTYSTTERLSSQARGRLANVSGGGILSGVVFLSGVLSAIFFWQNSLLVFSNVWPPAALALGLVVGLLPSEGAFFGWKMVRASKVDMTHQQLQATAAGLSASVITSIFSTFALFVASFQSVPAEIRAYSDWFVFLALSLPVIIQVVIYSRFAVNERGVVENFERSKLAALGFDAWIRHEQARMQSIINGMDAALDKQLESYGQRIGEQEAGAMLQDGSQQLLQMGQQSTHPTQQPGTAVPHQVAQDTPQTAVSQGNGVNPTQRYNGVQGG